MAIIPFIRVKSETGVRHFPLQPLSVCRLGRSDRADVILTDPAASREHALVHADQAGFCYVSDAGSRNGTRVNGRPVTAPVQLRDGDVIAIGRQELVFSDPGAAAAQVATTPVAGGAGAGDQTMFVAAEQSLITVLVLDIRGFTVLSREIGEARISALMTAVFRRAGELLDGAGAWSQKFIGDAVMAVWRHPQASAAPAEIAAVLRVVEALERLFAELQPRFGLPRPLRFGAAINTGPAAIGNMGSGSAADFTALGDTVNKAFRLESASKELGRDLVVGEGAMTFMVPPVPPRLLPPRVEAVLKGYDAAEPARVLDFADVPRFAAMVAAAGEPAGQAAAGG